MMLVHARQNLGRKENENKDMVKSGAKDKLRRVLQEDGAKSLAVVSARAKSHTFKW